jgi:antitoxin component of MazEF toxin-antitoxin module
MIRKVFQTGDSLAVSLPRESIELLGLHEGSELNIAVDADKGRIILSPLTLPIIDVDAAFARQLAEFIEQYRPALAALAR